MGNVAVLGAGPAGLFAAHAAVEAGHNVLIFARGDKSKLYGAQYLHTPIPGVDCGKPVNLDVRLFGTVAGYRKKVYGDNWWGMVSPDWIVNQGGSTLAWDIRAVYDTLWDRYASRLRPGELTRDNLSSFEFWEERGRENGDGYDFVITSLPMSKFCVKPDHYWKSQQVFAIGDAPDLGIRCPITQADFTMIYDGTREVGWYRSARVFGYTTCEWPANGRKPPPLANIAKVEKPLDTNCDCWPNFVRVGRYGKHSKDVLSHTAYFQVEKLLKGI